MSSPLAVLGGPAAVTHSGPHFRWPPIGPEMERAVLTQLHESISVYDRSGIVERLEDALCEYFGTRHAVLTSSGTAALHSAYVAAGIGPGDEVIVPAYTFLATATPLFHLGAIPVLADSDDHGNLHAADAALRIGPRTKAIVATHLWGRPADIVGLQKLARAHGLRLLEDGSHAHGATVGGRRVGSFGDLGAFSMNGPKPLSAGEGGFALTDDPECFYRLLAHGHYNKRCRTEIPRHHSLHRFAVTGMGLKFRIRPIAAAIALGQLRRLDEYLAGREMVAHHIIDGLSGLPGVRVPSTPVSATSAWYGLPLTYVADELDGLPIERFADALLAEGCHEVDRPGSTCPLNLHPLFQDPGALFPQYRGTTSYRPGEFPNAERVWSSTLKLPVWHREEDLPLVNQYVAAFRKVISHSSDLWRVSA